MSEPLWQPRTTTQARLLGLGFALAGWGLLHWQITLVIQSAREGAEKLTYSLTLILFGEMFLGLGAFLGVRGLAGYATIRSAKDNPKVKTRIMILAAVVGGGTWWLLRTKLQELGYSDV